MFEEAIVRGQEERVRWESQLHDEREPLLPGARGDCVLERPEYGCD